MEDLSEEESRRIRGKGEEVGEEKEEYEIDRMMRKELEKKGW